MLDNTNIHVSFDIYTWKELLVYQYYSVFKIFVFRKLCKIKTTTALKLRNRNIQYVQLSLNHCILCGRLKFANFIYIKIIYAFNREVVL